MKNHAALAAQATQCVQVLDDADFVVHRHHAGGNGVGAQSGGKGIDVHQTVGQHVQVGDLKALALQRVHGVQHGLVLGLDGDEVAALVLVAVRHAFEGQVVGLGGAAGPDDVARLGADQCGHLAARLLDGLFGFPAPGVAARGGIAKVLAQPGQHGLDHPRIDGRGGAVIQINRSLRCQGPPLRTC